jgi:hypothetical protein
MATPKRKAAARGCRASGGRGLDSQFRAAAASLAVSAAACDAISWHSGFRGGSPMNAQRKTTRVHHPARRRSGNVAARGARAAAGNAGGSDPPLNMKENP